MRALIFLILASTMRALADDFSDGNAAYDAGNFAAARTAYERVLASRADAATLYNLGNTFFRLGEKGRAALAYERALSLSPSHAEAAANLRFTRQQTGARVLDPGWPARVFGALPSAFAPWMSVAVAWLGIVWAGAALWRRSGATGLVCGTLLVVLGAGYGAGLAWWSARRATFAIVTVERAEARSEPSAKAGVAEALPAASRVRVLSTLGGWRFCELPTGANGWIAEKEIERLFHE